MFKGDNSIAGKAAIDNVLRELDRLDATQAVTHIDVPES